VLAGPEPAGCLDHHHGGVLHCAGRLRGFQLSRRPSCEFAKLIANLQWMIRLLDEVSSGRHVGGVRAQLAGGNQEGDRRPSVSHNSGKSKAVHRSRHLNVGEQNRYRRIGFQKGDRLIGINCLQDCEAQIADHISRIHAHQRFILNYQNCVFALCGFGHFRSSITQANLRPACSFHRTLLAIAR
jgi:hypothetical protein